MPIHLGAEAGLVRINRYTFLLFAAIYVLTNGEGHLWPTQRFHDPQLGSKVDINILLKRAHSKLLVQNMYLQDVIFESC